MKYLLLLTINFLFLSSSFSQSPYKGKLYGNSGDETVFSIIQTNDGGYAFTGSTTSGGAGGTDLYLTKTDSALNVLWIKTYGGPLNESGHYIRQLADSGFIIAALTESFGAGLEEGLIVRTDAAGDVIWSKTYGGVLGDRILAVEPTLDNNFILVGSTSSYGSGDWDILVLKIDQAGDTLWTRIIGGQYYDAAISVTQADDGGYTFSGRMASLGQGYRDVVIFKTDFNGDLLWFRTYGGLGDEEGMAIKQTNDGGYIVTGATTSFGLLSYEAYVLKTDADGILEWSRTYGGPKIDASYSVEQTTDNGFIITGFTDSYSYISNRNLPYNVLGDDSSDVLVLKLDANGDTLWSRAFGGLRTDEAYSVIQTNYGYIVGAYSNSFADSSDAYNIHMDNSGVSDCHTLYIHPIITIPPTVVNSYTPAYITGIVVNNAALTIGNTVWIETDSCTVTGIDEQHNSRICINIFPNPFRSSATILLPEDFELSGMIALTIYDVFGKAVRKITSPVSDNKINIEKGNLSDGIYFIELRSQENKIYTGKVIVAKQ
jgi:hypothetical protein